LLWTRTRACRFGAYPFAVDNHAVFLVDENSGMSVHVRRCRACTR
jgi:hypothetical protein